ncbi:ADP-ribosylglycohydrolase family protein [Planktothrix sp. FACHB-1355]|uniref:ADP-ribosylglycohydrolase family protein n=1 Tax=Aerosakkonema funiforme FACHB-1375 TaxID=2949571 RepID=A0A926VFT4_9CYAN|nr:MULTISPECIES: ADP-ribosylglycohydrolase family protein [Oscillatoriales]MBD2182893.1 ADP-ribosylglycohydrolase family protein [Aerosakkonema funiforme FACHB-1375]MBD3558047.1 ADP-ribosylglycohydrolase family protein [Planktothrix sp. FACHB-1355]
MQYSLLSRFRGALLGAAVGEIWGAYGNSWQLGVKQPSGQLYSWGRLVVRGTEGLIRQGKLDLADWRESPEETLPSPTDTGKHQDITASSYFPPKSVSGSGIVATVPVALFFHEDEAKLRQNLHQVADVWQDDSVLKDGTLAVGYAIALALKEKLDPATLIPQTLEYLDVETPLVQQLKQVQSLLDEGAGLEMTLATLMPRHSAPRPNAAIALAFYCFLSTLEDLRLSVIRASRCPQAQITGAIAGAISGAYNSIAGIPVGWRLALGDRHSSSGYENDSPLATLWGLNSEAELLRLAARLLAAWSGVYDADKFLIDTSIVAAVAAPKVIKPR